ncbi:winged helix DNA-binding protein [Nonomuraea fuscirosea]|uniref:Winged helix DNA-binding protein n=1 Tax=Nonomuraea fuscirosea TaxID=1291556 RepID=A0A2T0MTZ0_9ACTN|nr:transcriptional regulator [Nonomuraea fuscirosea]PRX62160.1 winged helix DNA-binding protein [Nonomuraea fuscirosea]
MSDDDTRPGDTQPDGTASDRHGPGGTAADRDVPDRHGPELGVPELDPVIHAQARLRVVATLNVLPDGDEMAFNSMKQLLGMTAGNLSVHLTKLEDAGYVRINKTHRGRTPVTFVALTKRGRLAFEEYTKAVRALLDNAGGRP